ncbi:sugar transporter [Meira miltonrushii]|uniref:Sugar transporter n=1 Tax=Meira miltonrushii TaxID=1280837 RepID=A0A316V5J0_9BASI|nr:sugar transporter [Meira miltonrushii]PWN32732.1 sugar transporter [Meira miltonrushii]
MENKEEKDKSTSDPKIMTNDVESDQALETSSPSIQGDEEKQGEPKAVINADLEKRLANPLKLLSREEVLERSKQFAHLVGEPDSVELFNKGALLARDPLLYESLPLLTDADRADIKREETHRWDHPKQLYVLVVCCSLGAVVQGMDQSVINGANLFFPTTFGIQNESTWFSGIINSAPYFSCALLACFVTEPLNYYFGRRGTVFITCFVAFATCIWSAVAHTYWNLIISRVALGFGIAPKSATVPVYASECVPSQIRGGLVMQWQLWTAFGIMLGYVADIAFYNVPDQSGIVGLNWRLMLGSAAIPPIAVMALVFFSPESPRWYLSKDKHREAYQAMLKLRKTPLRAARDLYSAYEGVLAERILNSSRSRNRLIEMVVSPRIRKGVQSSGFVMYMQQFCGINVNAYYSSTIFKLSGATELAALGASLGWGSVNWIMGFPAIWTIDKIGRRGLLLIGFPLMSIFLFWTAFSFYIQDQTARIAMVALGTYLHCCAYSPTEGPVPFTYSSESFPLAHRTLGMTWAVSVCWFFNGILSLTFPELLVAFTPTGAFSWYAAWNIFGFVYTYFLLPETKSLSLEELDAVFSVSNRDHAKYYWKRLPHDLSWLVKFGKKEPYNEFLYEHEKLTLEEREERGALFAQAAAGH